MIDINNCEDNDYLSLIDGKGELLVLVELCSDTVRYELHNSPYIGVGEVICEWMISNDCLRELLSVYKGEGDGSTAMESILVGNGKPVRVVTKLDKVGPIYKTVEYHHIDTKVPAPDVPMQSTTGGFTLHYSNEHPAIKDCYADDAARDLAHQDVYTSTGLVVEAALCLIMEGVLGGVSITIEGRPLASTGLRNRPTGGGLAPLTINPDHGIVTDYARFPSRDYSKRLMLAMISKYKKPV